MDTRLGADTHGIKKGHFPMTQLIVLFLGGAALLAFFVYLFLTSGPASNQDMGSTTMLQHIVSLPGIGFDKPQLLFNDRDYRFLRSIPKLEPLADQLRRERRDMVLLWFRLLHQDVVALLRFRRFLVRNDVAIRLTEEFQVDVTAISAIFYLYLLRLFFWFAGPFVLPRVINVSRHRVEMVSRICAGILARLPAAQRTDIEGKWAEEIA